MKTNHECSAPICPLDTNPNYKDEVIWMPGEPVCRNKPYVKFQEIQIKINELVSKGKYDLDKQFTASQLEGLRFAKRSKKRS